MNRLLFNRSCLSLNSFLRNYSVKSACTNIKPLAKEPTKFVFKPVIYQFSNHCLKQFVSKYSTKAPLNVNPTNLAKDIIVFKYENPQTFKYMNIFGIVQFFCWIIFAESTMYSMKYVPVDADGPNFENLPFYLKVNLGENKYKWSLAIGSFLLGSVILGFVWMFTLRSVRYLIFRKGGNKVAFVTYGPFGINRIMDVPLNCISAVHLRNTQASSLPLKVKGKPFYYMLDNRGIYTNPEIFDHVINLKRRVE